jgi:Trypsin-co-occurring domain 1
LERSKLNMPGEDTGRAHSYEVGVSLVSFAESAPQSAQTGQNGTDQDTVPGYDDAIGVRKRTARLSTQIRRGDDAVREATEAIADQIGIAAQRIAETIDRQVTPSANGQSLALDEVEISFGVSLTAGVQALFTAQADSSAQVTIRLSRQAVGQPAGS